MHMGVGTQLTTPSFDKHIMEYQKSEAFLLKQARLLREERTSPSNPKPQTDPSPPDGGGGRGRGAGRGKRGANKRKDQEDDEE